MKERIENIKGLINKEDLLKSVDVNNDRYGGACVNVAINVMEYLDEFEGEFNIGYHPDTTTTHGIICKCDDEGGITGLMASAVRNMVARCHELGWKFYIADVLNKYNFENKDEIKEIIKNVIKADLASYKDASVYISELVERFKNR